jgi:hypothetical protein
MRPCLAVQASDITLRIVEAHELMHFCDGIESRLDGGVHFGMSGAGGRDLHERSEQRSRAANAI